MQNSTPKWVCCFALGSRNRTAEGVGELSWLLDLPVGGDVEVRNPTYAHEGNYSKPTVVRSE